MISDYTVTEKILKYFIHKAMGRKNLPRPRVSVCIPAGPQRLKRERSLTLQWRQARDVIIIEEPIAAALGAGIDISKPSGNMIIDIGGGNNGYCGDFPWAILW